MRRFPKYTINVYKESAVEYIAIVTILQFDLVSQTSYHTGEAWP